MTITLYTAPNCLRCKIVKEFLADRGLEYTGYDFKADKDIFNAFYRANRSAIYRNPEGVEFPVYDDGVVIRQGTGEILAYLLAGRALEGCVSRSELLHGWISGLNVSACPPDREDAFRTLVRLLSKGGLSVQLHTDGRRAELLEQVLADGCVARVVLDVVGPAALYPVMVGGVIERTDLARSIAAVRAHADHLIRLPVGAYVGADGATTCVTPEDVGLAARMIVDAYGDIQLPVFIEAIRGQDGNLPEGQALLAYRAKARNALVRTEIRKQQGH